MKLDQKAVVQTIATVAAIVIFFWTAFTFPYTFILVALSLGAALLASALIKIIYLIYAARNANVTSLGRPLPKRNMTVDSDGRGPR